MLTLHNLLQAAEASVDVIYGLLALLYANRDTQLSLQPIGFGSSPVPFAVSIPRCTVACGEIGSNNTHSIVLEIWDSGYGAAI